MENLNFTVIGLEQPDTPEHLATYSFKTTDKIKAMKKANEFRKDRNVYVYIQVFRISDQQHFYLNPVGNFSLTGVAW